MTQRTRNLLLSLLACCLMQPAQAQVSGNFRQRAGAFPSWMGTRSPSVMNSLNTGHSGGVGSYRSGNLPLAPGLSTYSSGISTGRYALTGSRFHYYRSTPTVSVAASFGYPKAFRYRHGHKSIRLPIGRVWGIPFRYPSRYYFGSYYSSYYSYGPAFYSGSLYGGFPCVSPYIGPYIGPYVIPYVSWNNVYPTIIAPPVTIPYSTLAPVPFGSAVSVQPGNPLPPVAAPVISPQPAAFGGGMVTENGEPVSQPLDNSDVPVVNEFPAAVIAEENVAAADRMRSLRYQTSGDDAFRRGDYPTAEVFYRTAADTAPARRAPRLRLAWVRIAQKEYETAVVDLKQALQMTLDPTTAWIDGAELYRDRLHSAAVFENEALLQWVQQQPHSTDRLLLAAAFQKLTGRSSIAKELMDHADRGGLDATLVQALRDMTMRKPDDAGGVPKPPRPMLTEQASQTASTGIRIHGAGQSRPATGL